MDQVKNLAEIKGMIRAQVRARFSRRPYGTDAETLPTIVRWLKKNDNKFRLRVNMKFGSAEIG